MALNEPVADSLFETSYRSWIDDCVRTCKGERKRRLQEGLGYGEKMFLSAVWWPAFRSLEHLHPEYEVQDFKDGSRFLDFAYIRHELGLYICIEIDAYGTHLRNLSRWEYDDHVDRQNDLVMDDWKVLRFTHDRIKDKPRQCQQKLLQAFGKWNVERSAKIADNPLDQTIVQLLENYKTPHTITEIAHKLGWRRNTIAKRIRFMITQGDILQTNSGARRHKRFMINQNSRRKSAKQL